MKRLETKFLPLVLENITEAVIIFDTEFRIIFANSAAEELTGFKKEEMLGKFCFEVLRTDHCQKNCVIKSGDTFPKKEILVNIINKWNEQRYVKLNVFEIKDESGELIGWGETLKDITREVVLEKEIESKYKFEDIVTVNKKLLEVLSVLPKIAQSDVPVLIEGESGTGKELLATAIRNFSFRADKPFLKLNCAAIPEALLESELFGYKKGAFTDAKTDKPGLFSIADGGTLFLDEIAEIPINLQAKLLRAIETGEIIPVGASRPEEVDVRIIAATNQNLQHLVQEGKFRKDLFYRLNVVYLKIPPLRERKEDIPYLVQHFIEKFNLLKKKQVQGLTDRAMKLLLAYDFPGNVRELKNIIERAFIFVDSGLIDVQHLPEHLHSQNLKKEMDERSKILEALEKAKWNRKKAAELLSIDRTTLWRKMKKYGLL